MCDKTNVSGIVICILYESEYENSDKNIPRINVDNLLLKSNNYMSHINNRKCIIKPIKKKDINNNINDIIIIINDNNSDNLKNG